MPLNNNNIPKKKKNTLENNHRCNLGEGGLGVFAPLNILMQLFLVSFSTTLKNKKKLVAHIYVST